MVQKTENMTVAEQVKIVIAETTKKLLLILGEIGVGYYLCHFIKTYRNDKHSKLGLLWNNVATFDTNDTYDNTSKYLVNKII